MTKSKNNQDKEERARDAAQATLEYHAEGLAVREKTARLRELRLAKKAVDEAAVGKKLKSKRK
jgi:hypothetical protein